ncbi:MAG: helix-hairpin-helix domain-containing protein [bacterium]|nr:helix-hairpin-helix domain-containing protein [bacterium]
MTKQEAAAALRHYAVLLELVGEDPFRARAFENAARMLETQPENLDVLIAENRLSAVRGIGKGVAAAIRDLNSRGTFAELEEARQGVPSGVIELLRVEGLGPKKARTLWKDAQVTSLAALENAIEAGLIERLPGFGAKTAQKFRVGLAFLKSTSGRHWRHHAVRAAESLRESLKDMAGVREVFFGGSLRRGNETVGDLDVLLIAEEGQANAVRTQVASLSFVRWSEAGHILRGELASGFRVELSVTAPDEAGARKILATGSKEHVRALQEIAAGKGYTLDPQGVGNVLRAGSEEQVYAALGLAYVPPPLREGSNSVFEAGSRTYPEPVRLNQIRGILHCHTTASDGHHSLRELAAAVIERGYEYLGVADHSQSAAYAHGLTPERVRAQWKEIDELNGELTPFRILKGTEVDILPDGRLDFDDELLAGFDFVVASVHSGFNMSEEDATARLCRALENPQVDILGHPTGRLLLERNGYAVNHTKLMDCAARTGKAIELNCSPHRLDLDWHYLALAEAKRVPVPLCPDAHHIEGLWDIRWGVEVAAKGPLTAANCPSTWSADEFVRWCASHA